MADNNETNFEAQLLILVASIDASLKTLAMQTQLQKACMDSMTSDGLRIKGNITTKNG